MEADRHNGILKSLFLLTAETMKIVNSGIFKKSNKSIPVYHIKKYSCKKVSLISLLVKSLALIYMPSELGTGVTVS